MAQADSEPIQKSFTQLLEELLRCTDSDFLLWLHEHRTYLSLGFLQYLKDNLVTSAFILRDPQRAEQITRYILQISAILPHEPLALPLGQWMRGIWASYNHTTSAAILYQSALPAYQVLNDRLSVAKLYSNLVGVLANLNENDKAEYYYRQARYVFLEYVDKHPSYLVALEQNFGYLLHSWGRYEEALDIHDWALALATQHNFTPQIAEIRVNRHLTLGRLGRFSEIEDGFLQDRKIAAQAEQWLTVARIDMDLGELYTILGRPIDALQRFQQAAKAFVPMEQGPVLAIQATLLRHLGAFRSACLQYESALPLLEEYGLKTFHAETLVNFAICLRLGGDAKQLRRARNLLQQSELVWSEQQNQYWQMQTYLEQIRLALAQEKLEQAVALLKQPPAFSSNLHLQAEFQLLRAEVGRNAIEAENPPDHFPDRNQITQDYQAVIDFAQQERIRKLERDALVGLGRFCLAADWEKAQSLLEAASEIDDQLRQVLNIQELKASFHEQANDLYSDLIRGAFAQRAFGLLLEYVWRAKASAFLDLATNTNLAQQANEGQEQKIVLLRQQIAALRWALAKDSQQNLQDAYREISSPELSELTQQLLELRRQASPHVNFDAQSTTRSFSSLLERLDADLLIEYVRCDREIYGIVGTRTAVLSVKRLVDCEEIEDLAGYLIQGFESYQRLRTPERLQVANLRIEESRIYLRQCFERLVAPFLPELADWSAFHKILIAPCDVMAMLPFAAFWTGSCYWVEMHEIELIQSGALLQLELPRAAHFSPAVVVAASAGEATAVRNEAEAVAALLPNQTTFIDTPVLSYLRQLQFPPKILHIAAHTIHRGDAPLFTGIQLSGEVLSVEESFDLPLWGTELVVLSGCTTAGGLESDAALFAFQSAFLLAGAQRLLCTLWPIADGTLSPMITYFYQVLQQGSSVTEALRQTQLYFLQTATYKHPALWAAVTTIRR